jgi:hypothetical protein
MKLYQSTYDISSESLLSLCNGPTDVVLNKFKWPEEQVEWEWDVKVERELKVKSKCCQPIRKDFVKHSVRVVGRDESTEGNLTVDQGGEGGTSHHQPTGQCGSKGTNDTLNIPCNGHGNGLDHPTEKDRDPPFVFIWSGHGNGRSNVTIDGLLEKVADGQRQRNSASKFECQHSGDGKPHPVHGRNGLVNLDSLQGLVRIRCLGDENTKLLTFSGSIFVITRLTLRSINSLLLLSSTSAFPSLSRSSLSSFLEAFFCFTRVHRKSLILVDEVNYERTFIIRD